MTLIQERNFAVKQAIEIKAGRYALQVDSAQRFDITEIQAERQIHAFPKKQIPRNPSKKRLQAALVTIFETLIRQYPDISKGELFTRIVMSPAPEFFISKRVAKEIVNKLIRKENE